jgi:uncharacterized protein (DUF1501 family)
MANHDATRRHLLKMGGALSVFGAAAPFAAQLTTMSSAAAQSAPDYRALVCLFMFGGNDAHNMLLATDADSWGRYWAARNIGNDPIALMPVGAAPVAAGATSPITGRVSSRSVPEFLGGVLPITPRTPNPVPAGTNAPARTFAINPVMAPLLPLWQAGRLAAIANVGPLIVPTTKAQYQTRSVRLPANLMSHNDQQSTWMAGATEGARRGWGGLMADTMLSSNGANSIFTGVSVAGNTVFLAGQTAIQYQMTTNAAPAVRINAATGTTLNGSAVAAQRLRDIIRADASTSLFGQDQAAVVRRSMDVADTLNAAFASAAATAIPAPTQHLNPVTGAMENNALAVQLQSVARSIAANQSLGLRRQVFFVSIGGWDTHDVQNTTHPVLLSRVAHAMAYFDGVLGSIGGLNMRNNVTTFTMSDFSRTFTTNGDGTDHAWGGHQLVMGGAVRGQDIFGQYPTLGVDQGSFRNPDNDRNITIPTTAVDQMAATLGRWFGVSDSQLATIFPNLRNFAAANLGFMTA